MSDLGCNKNFSFHKTSLQNIAILAYRNLMNRILSAALSSLGTACMFSCTAVKTEHHITLDHNITIKIEKEVNDFLDDLYDDDTESTTTE